MGADSRHSTRRRLLIVAMSVVLATSMTLPAADGTKAVKAGTDAVLTPGRPWFHEHPEPITATMHESACTKTTCPEFAVSIAHPVWRLRVGIAIRYPGADHVDALGDPQVWPSFDLRVSPPEGPARYVSLGTTPYKPTPVAAPKYHNELLWEDPPVGTWTITVIPTQVRGVGFRLRAAVEEFPEVPVEEKTLLPDLRAVPPFEIRFMAPTASYAPGAATPSARTGCMAEDVEEAVLDDRPPPSSCLRVSLGVENAGPGPLLLNTPSSCFSSPHECVQEVPIEQRFYVRDPHEPGPTYWRLGDDTHAAGTGRWHATHVHLHYGDMYEARLFRVDETTRKPTVAPVGDGHKIGFNPVDEWMADWHDLDQGPFDCCWRDATIFLSPGWGDIYEWNRSGNYVDFPTDALGRPTPGRYVVQGETDPDALLRESNERNNRAYAYFEVDGSGRVRTLERGYGDGPWDPQRQKTEVTP